MNQPVPQRRDLDLDLLQIMLGTAALVLLVPMPLWLVATISFAACGWSFALFRRFGRRQRQTPSPSAPSVAPATRTLPVERPVALLMVLALVVGLVAAGLLHLPDWFATAYIVLTLLIGTAVEIRLGRSSP